LCNFNVSSRSFLDVPLSISCQKKQQNMTTHSATCSPFIHPYWIHQLIHEYFFTRSDNI
jgi:hypothetical protein